MALVFGLSLLLQPAYVLYKIIQVRTYKPLICFPIVPEKIKQKCYRDMNLEIYNHYKIL
jgi:hypothetical protein